MICSGANVLKECDISKGENGHNILVVARERRRQQVAQPGKKKAAFGTANRVTHLRKRPWSRARGREQGSPCLAAPRMNG